MMIKGVTPAQYIQKNWLLIGIITSIFLAGVYPWFGSKEGPLWTDITVKYVAVSCIFLISGLSLKTEALYKTFRLYKLHLFVQLFSFVAVPLITQVYIRFWTLFGANPWILKGLITVACMPPAVSTATVLTKAANGNETVAIFNSVLGSFLGIVLTPLLLLCNLGMTTVVPLLPTLFHLMVTVLLPLIVGQVLRRYLNMRKIKLPFSTIGQCALLFIVYSTFCDTFLTPEIGLTAPDIIITVFSVVLMQIILMVISFRLSKIYLKEYNDQDVIASVYCCTHKSLTLGLPILRIMFHGYSYLSQISLPLLAYHPTQIMLGGLLVSHFQEWAQHRRTKRSAV